MSQIEAVPAFAPATVTVAIIARNAESYLTATLDSLRAQTFGDFNVVIVDDGSTDDTGELAERYAANWSRLTVLRQSPQGIPAARNRILAGVRSKYVAVLDADDLARPQRLQVQVDFMERHPACALCASGYEVFETLRPGSVLNRRSVALGSRQLATMLAFRNPILHSTVMLRTEVLRAAGPYDPALACAEDYDLWARLAVRHELAMLPDVLVRYRRHARQSIHRMSELMLRNHVAVMRRLYEALGVPLEDEWLRRLAFPREAARLADMPGLTLRLLRLRHGLSSRGRLDFKTFVVFARRVLVDVMRAPRARPLAVSRALASPR